MALDLNLKYFMNGVYPAKKMLFTSNMKATDRARYRHNMPHVFLIL